MMPRYQDSRTQAQIDRDDQILIDRALARAAQRQADQDRADAQSLDARLSLYWNKA
jgi:hypothetical protein